ncbi:lipopolysaccharide transport periplasmic protein LptA [Alteromonas genovensis]|uniref:Lipopolysaccharide export system protein LptA n=1 Tax=Alteromonas genovensis TaxID=471225 RepID=A0A6N9THN6_9ALTE|nr:lipopolysaccharide transport periplasmic protein LptA [Alteromonas genovensis]NDW16837.1 lipopolysaccharide transport periplasmic protein LptA [Alteromonas genovensis]
MYKLRILLATSALLVLCTSPALGNENDFTLPIEIGSNSQFIDGKNKTALYKDNVLITQGSLTIEADEVEVIASQGSGREIFVARGNPASYSQELEDGNPVSARANEIRYEVAKRTISLTGNAELKQDTSQVKGNSITFDMITEQLLATGGAGDASGRVTTVFTPESIRKANDETSENDNGNDNDGSNGDGNNNGKGEQ